MAPCYPAAQDGQKGRQESSSRVKHVQNMNYSNQVAERLDGVSQGTNPAAVSS